MVLKRQTVLLLALLATLIITPSVAFAGLVSADLSITKTDGVASVTPGGSITYTITASNAGPADVTGASVTDTFPASLTCTWTCAASAGSSCTAAGAGNIADSVDLLVGGTATYSATCDVDPAATGTLDNTATVSSGLTDPMPADNSATDSDALTPSADLSVALDVSPNPPNVGDSVTIMVTVSNAGPSDATGVVVSTTLPGNLTFVSTTGCVEDPAGVPTCTLGTVPAGQMASFTIEAIAGAGADGSVDVTVTSAVSDPTPGNDSASVEVLSIEQIPTLGGVGLVSLVLLLAGLGFWTMRRRRQTV